MGDNVTLDDIPHQDAITNQTAQSWAEGRPDLPEVNLPDNFVFTPVDPLSRGKTYEVLIDTVYNHHHDSINADSEVAALVNQNSGNVAATVILRYAEVSETYLGSDGNYYVATFTRIYVPAGSQYADTYQEINGLHSENDGTLWAPGVASLSIEDGATITLNTRAVEAGEFSRVRLATSDEIESAQGHRQDAIDRGFILNSDGTMQSPGSCFGPEASISMWPLDPEFAPYPNKQYDQDAVRAKIWKKPIEQIRVDDYVVSHDKNDNMVPGYVPRTMSNDAKILLNFHGTPVTPGHVYYRPDSKKSYKYETLIDILRDDGVIKHQDGTLIRAATNVPIDDDADRFVAAYTGARQPDGSVITKEHGRIRLGTRFVVEGKRTYSVADVIKAGGGFVGGDELICVGDGKPMAFHWEFGDTLPKPEDFVLACSNTTLEDIYKAAEWEDQQPQMPAPMVMDGGPVQPLSHKGRSKLPRNEPLVLDRAKRG